MSKNVAALSKSSSFAGKNEPSKQPVLMMVTPEMAQEWLTRNTNNRRLSKGTVAAYARDIVAGDWLVTGDAIRFDNSGMLIDGQHRLQACIQAELPFNSYVIGGLDSAVMRVIDHPRIRTVADNMHRENLRHPVLMAAASRWLFVFKYGSLAIGKGRVTPTEVMRMANRHPKLERSCAVSNGCFGVTASILSAVHYVAANLVDGADQETADNFAAVFTAGQSFYPDDAALAWRERLLRMREARTRLVQEQMQRGTVHAWNLFRQQIPVKNMRIPDVVLFDGLDYETL